MKTFYLPKITDETCPHCQTTQRVEVERDDEGNGYAMLETTPCHADDCTRKLCANCPQFVCDCCGLTHCLEHRSMIGGLAYCPVGAAEYWREAAGVELADGRIAAALAQYVRAEIGTDAIQ